MLQLIETHSPLFICGGTVKDGSASLEVWSTTCNWHWGQEVERGHLHLSPSNHQPSFRTTDSPKTFLGHLPQRQPGWCCRCFVVDPTHAHTHTSACKGMEPDISSESSLFVSRASGLVFTYWCRSRRKNGRRLFLHVLQSIWKRLCSTEDWHSPSISRFPRSNQPTNPAREKSSEEQILLQFVSKFRKCLFLISWHSSEACDTVPQVRACFLFLLSLSSSSLPYIKEIVRIEAMHSGPSNGNRHFIKFLKVNNYFLLILIDLEI